MSEMNAKRLSDQEIEQVVGGEKGGGASGDWGDDDGSGGLTVSWARRVCPFCHGDVRLVRSRALVDWSRYECRNCGKTWEEEELVEES